MRCPACQHDNPEAVKFCGECGTRLEARCSGCGASNPPANKFCHECGESLRPSPRPLTGPPLPGPALAAPPLASPQLTGERRHATIVFSDLAGYTAMNERLDPEEVEALLGRIKEAAVAIVERHGGMVNQFVGDEVLALFGIPLAHEDDPLRAVRAALELHDMVRAMSPEVEERIGQALRMHTGIHTGLIVTNQRDDRDGRIGIVGNTVNLGARLKVLAAVDDILVSPETQRAIAPFVDTQALDALSVKGKSEPVVPHRVVAPAKTRTRFEAVARRGLAPHVGRAAELATLRAGLDAACAGQGRVVTLSGEAGMGKSRLLHELRAAIEGTETAVLQGSCLAYGDSTSYLPFLDAMQGLLGLREDGNPDEIVARVVAGVEAIDTAVDPAIGTAIGTPGHALAEHVPLYLHLLSLRSPAHPLPEHLTGEALQHAAEEALAELFLASARRQPVALLLEDWHWTDEASAAALLHLAGRLGRARLLVVITHRPDRRAEWPAEWQAQGRHIRIDLGALTLVPTRMLVASRIAARELPDALIAVIHERTGGNPFFVEELCRALVEEGALVVRDDRAVPTQPIDELVLPDTVQAIIRTRLDRLDAAARDVLRLASVIGKRFSRRLLADLYEDRARLDTVLASLVARDLLQETRGAPEVEYMFRQALTQEVAYDTLRIEQRKALHALVGSAIETLHAARLEEHVNLLLHHFRRAEVWPSAIAYGQRAAERAAELSQFQRAISILEDVLAWVANLPDVEQRAGLLIDVLLRQERLYETLGRRDEQQRVIDRLFELLAAADRPGSDAGRPRAASEGTGGRADSAAGRLAEVYVRQGDLHTQLGRYEDAERALGQALARRQALGDPVGEAQVLRSMGFLRWHQGRYDEAVGCNEAALAIDRRRQDLAAMAMDLTNLGAVLRNVGDHARARDCLEEAQALYQAVGRPARQAFTLYSIANIARDLGDLDLAMAQYQRAHEIFTEHGDHVMSSRALAAMAGIHWDTGHVDESIQLSRDVVHMTREAAYGPGLSHALHTLAERLSASGEHADAVGYLLESTEVFAKLGERHSEAEVWERLARAHEQHLGDARQALAAWDNVRALRLQIRDRAGAMAALQEMARIAREKLRAPHEALAHLERALELAAELGALTKQGEIRNAMGIVAWRLEDYPAALAHYEHARTCFRALGSTTHEGFILNSIGVTLHKLGRLDEALAHLDEALVLLRQADQRLLAGHALAAVGDIHRERGAFDQALQAYQASLELRRDIGDHRGEAWMHGALAQVHAARADRERMRVHVLAARAVLSHHPDDELGRVLDALAAPARAGDA